jgi:hypothetical protein
MHLNTFVVTRFFFQVWQLSAKPDVKISSYGTQHDGFKCGAFALKVAADLWFSPSFSSSYRGVTTQDGETVYRALCNNSDLGEALLDCPSQCLLSPQPPSSVEESDATKASGSKVGKPCAAVEASEPYTKEDFFFELAYFCTYVCVFVCLSVCLFVCLSLYVCACQYVCTYLCMYVCMYVRTYVRTYVCVSVCMYVCTYVCMKVGR